MTDPMEPTTATTDGTTVVLPGPEFAHAWRDITRACSLDEDRPIIGGVSVELYGTDTVRLTATDSYSLLTCVVGGGAGVGDYDRKPGRSWIVHPMGGVSRNAMKRVLRFDGGRDVILTFDGSGCSMRSGSGSEQVGVQLPFIPGDYPSWRPLLSKAEDEVGGQDVVTLGHLTLPLLAALVGDGRAAEIRSTGDPKSAQGPHRQLAPALVRFHPSWPRTEIRGLVMPVRVS